MVAGVNKFGLGSLSPEGRLGEPRPWVAGQAFGGQDSTQDTKGCAVEVVHIRGHLPILPLSPPHLSRNLSLSLSFFRRQFSQPFINRHPFVTPGPAHTLHGALEKPLPSLVLPRFYL